MCERHGDAVRIACDHGFGPDGPAETEYPFAGSFTALVVSTGQTAYLEDTRLRPDLHFPRPAGGDPLRAALAAPLRVHGRVA